MTWTYTGIVIVVLAAIVVSWIGWGVWAAFSHVYAIVLTGVGAVIILLARSGVGRSRRVERRDEPFMGYPEGQVLGIFDARDDAAAALVDLRGRGFGPHQLSVLVGASGSAQVDSEGVAHGLTGITQRSIEHLLTNKDDLEQYDQALRRGAVVLAVEAPDDWNRSTVSEAFQRHGGYEVMAFGTFVVEKLDADPSRT